MNLGTKVSLKGVDRCLSPVGTFTYLDPPIDINGVVVERAVFIDEQVCIEFLIDYQKHRIWKYVFDIPEQDA